jgi:flagellar basal-body rod modification protein FlgD
MMSTIQGTSAATSSAAGNVAGASASASTIQNSFLTLLVTQLKNQDPLNPMDNAQLTSQLAQISTVNGIQQLNSTMQGLGNSFSSGQSLQAAALIGHRVLTSGNTLALSSGAATGGVQLDGNASSVIVQISDPAGNPIRSIDLGAKAAGIAQFQWDGMTDAGSQAAAGTYSFKVKAVSGSQSVGATSLTAGNVSSVTLGSGGIGVNVDGIGALQLQQIMSIL